MLAAVVVLAAEIAMTQTEGIMEDVIAQISAQIILIEMLNLNLKESQTEGTTRKNHVIPIIDQIAAVNLNRTIIIIISEEREEAIITLTNAVIRDDYYSDMTTLGNESHLAFR